MHNEGIKRMIERQHELGKQEEDIKRKEVAALFMERARLHAIVRGKVQGVFFRDFIKKTADSLGLVGWVKNKDDTVEIVAEGEKNALRKLLIAAKEGSPLSDVKDVEYEYLDFTGKFNGFFVDR